MIKKITLSIAALLSFVLLFDCIGKENSTLNALHVETPYDYVQIGMPYDAVTKKLNINLNTLDANEVLANKLLNSSPPETHFKCSANNRTDNKYSSWAQAAGADIGFQTLSFAGEIAANVNRDFTENKRINTFGGIAGVSNSFSMVLLTDREYRNRLFNSLIPECQKAIRAVAETKTLEDRIQALRNFKNAYGTGFVSKLYLKSSAYGIVSLKLDTSASEKNWGIAVNSEFKSSKAIGSITGGKISLNASHASSLGKGVSESELITEEYQKPSGCANADWVHKWVTQLQGKALSKMDDQIDVSSVKTSVPPIPDLKYNIDPKGPKPPVQPPNFEKNPVGYVDWLEERAAEAQEGQRRTRDQIIAEIQQLQNRGGLSSPNHQILRNSQNKNLFAEKKFMTCLNNERAYNLKYPFLSNDNNKTSSINWGDLTKGWAVVAVEITNWDKIYPQLVDPDSYGMNIGIPIAYAFYYQQQRIKEYFDWIRSINPGNEGKYKEFGSKEINQYIGVYNELLERLLYHINYKIDSKLNLKGKNGLLLPSNQRIFTEDEAKNIVDWWWKEVREYQSKGRFSQNFAEYLDALRKNYKLMFESPFGCALSLKLDNGDYAAVDYDLDIKIINKGSKSDNAFFSEGARFFPIMGYSKKKVFFMTVSNEECKILGLAELPAGRDPEAGRLRRKYEFTFFTGPRTYSIGYFEMLANNRVELVSPTINGFPYLVMDKLALDPKSSKRIVSLVKDNSKTYRYKADSSMMKKNRPCFIITKSSYNANPEMDRQLMVGPPVYSQIPMGKLKEFAIGFDENISSERNSKNLSTQEQEKHKGRSI